MKSEQTKKKINQKGVCVCKWEKRKRKKYVNSSEKEE